MQHRPRSRVIAALILPVLPVLLALPAVPAGAQTGDDGPAIVHYQGGATSVEVAAASLALLGPGAAGLQATQAPIYAGPGRHLHNPALLGLARRPMLSLDVSPSFGIGVGGLLDLEAEFASATDDALADYLDEDSVVSHGSASARLRHPGGLTGAAFVRPAGPVTFAFATDPAFSLELGLVAAGISTRADIEKEVGDAVEVVRLRADLDAALRVRLRARRYSLGVGFEPSPRLWAGLGLDVVSYRMAVEGRIDAEGIMSTNGREFIFGDPSDPWENSLDQSLDGLYAGRTLTFRVGAGWRPLPWLAAGGTLQLPASASLGGEADVVVHRLEAYDEEDGIDPANLSLSQPTRTELVDSPVDDAVELSLPGGAGLGVAFLTGPVTTTLDWQGYWGDFSLGYLDGGIELHPRHLLKLGLNVPHFSLGLGALLCSPRYRFGGDWEEPGLVPLAVVTVGTGLTIAERLRLDLALEAAPLPTLKLATGILF